MSHSTIVIQPEGSLDVNSSETLRRNITDALASGTSSILIDCQNITFMDSSGLSAMVMALKSSKEAGTRLALCAVGEQAGLLFSLTGMEKVFDIFKDRAAFEASAQQPVVS